MMLSYPLSLSLLGAGVLASGLLALLGSAAYIFNTQGPSILLSLNFVGCF